MNPTSKVTKKLDRLWQKAIVKIMPNCLFCGRASTVGHHVLHKSTFLIRWHILAGIGLCQECHNHHDKDLKEKSKQAFIKKYGNDCWRELKILSNQFVKNIDIEAIEIQLKKFI